MNSLSASPTVSIGMTTAATIQKWPRTMRKLRLKPPMTPCFSSSTTGPASER